jgi:DNA-binding transcriptional LysR family regulator
MFHGKEYILEVYRTKSFSKAAAKLYISQPALSATIKRLEAQLGFPVFDRSTAPVKPTEYGLEYIKAAERMKEIEQDFENYLNDVNQLKTGHLSIGSNHLCASFILPLLIREFKEIHPSIEVDLIEASTPHLEQLLFSGELDFVVDNYLLKESVYARHLLYGERLILAVPREYACNGELIKYQLTAEDILNGKHMEQDVPGVPLELFQDYPFIFLKAGNDTRLRADRICSESNIKPRIIMVLDQLVTAYNIVCTGMGITFVSDTLIQKVSPERNLVFYKLSGPYTYREVYLYNRSNRYVTKAMQEFIGMTAKKNGSLQK